MTDVNITLTRAEAVVLFEWLSKIDAMESPPFGDPSEQTVVWRAHGQLESLLKEPFASNYAEVLRQARQEVQAGGE